MSYLYIPIFISPRQKTTVLLHRKEHDERSELFKNDFEIKKSSLTSCVTIQISI